MSQQMPHRNTGLPKAEIGNGRVAICIVGFGNVADIERCVDALSAQSYEKFEIIICENAGGSAAEVLREALADRLPGCQRLRVISADNPGYAGGVNHCINESIDASAWWILNPDTVVDSGALAAVIGRLDRGDVDAVGGVVAFKDGRVQGAGGRWNPWIARAESIGNGAPIGALPAAEEIERRQNYILGTSMLISRYWLERVGMMPECYFLYGEEIAWCLKAAHAGLKLGHAPDAIIWHDHGTTTGASTSIHDRGRLAIQLDERNKVNLVRDFHPLRIVPAVVASLLIINWRYTRRRAWKQLRFAFAGWLDGLANRRGRPTWMRGADRSAAGE